MTSLTLLQHRAYEHLKNSIMSGELRSGYIYSETRIAKELGLSRTPVRDALQRLSQNKLVNIIPNKGFMVHKMTAADVIETYQVRGAIEGYATTQIAKDYQTPQAQQTIQKLLEISERQKQLLETSPFDVNTFTDVDHLFHTTIVSYMNNENFSELFDNHMYRIHMFAIDSFKYPVRPQEALAEHSAILSAIQKGDVPAVYEATLFHMEAPQKIMLERIAKEEANTPKNEIFLAKCQL